MSSEKGRFRKERLESVVEIAKAAGARVRVNLRSGEAVIDFSPGVPSHDEDEGARIQELLNSMTGGKTR